MAISEYLVRDTASKLCKLTCCRHHISSRNAMAPCRQATQPLAFGLVSFQQLGDWVLTSPAMTLSRFIFAPLSMKFGWFNSVYI